MTALTAAIVLSMLCGAPSAPTEATTKIDAAVEQKIARLVGGLGSDKFAAREASMYALAEIGDAAVPLLKKAQAEPDLEVRRRVRTALTMIRWRISRELHQRVGNVMDGFEKRDHTERERIVRAVASDGEKHAIPTLARVVEHEQHRSVWLTAVWALWDMGPEGQLALAELGVTKIRTDRLDVGIRIRLGNSLLEDGQYDKAIEQYTQVLKKEPDNEIALYNMVCAYSLKKQIDQALDWLRKALDAGYDDANWMDNDSDLDNIRDQPRYKQMLRELRVKERLNRRPVGPRT